MNTMSIMAAFAIGDFAEGDIIISRCINLSGFLKIRVEKVLKDSMVTRILNSVEHAAENKPRIDRFITIVCEF